MHYRSLIVGGLATVLLLSACDRSDPPSERLERAAEELVAEVEATGAPEAPPVGPYAPRNECGDLPGGVDFLASLQAAIDTRDTDALLALAAPDVKLDFGGGAGRDELRDLLEADEGAFWEELSTMFELGCAADETAGMTIPWYFAQHTDVDPYAGVIVIGQDVPLYEGPAGDRPVLAQLSWEAVERLPQNSDEGGFAQVRWTDPESDEEMIGFIAETSLRAIIDYRLLASRRNNRWHITALVAGD